MAAPRCLVRGSVNIDEFFHVKDICRPGETISSDSLEKRAGGKGANQAVAVARAGGQADLVGAIGDDGQWVLSHLKSLGVNVSGLEIAMEATGRALIQVTDEGENSIILYKGANFAPRRHPSSSRSIHERTTHMLLQNEITHSATLAYLDAAQSSLPHRISTIFNPSPMPSASQIKAFPWTKLNWLIVNEVEASDLCKHLAPDTEPSTSKYAQSAAASFPAFPYALTLSDILPTVNLVCTIGSEGVIALLPSLTDDPSPIHLPAAKLRGNVRDTTGAGDCFTGYLAAGLMKLEERHIGAFTRDEIIHVLIRCVQAAGMCVERRGTLDSIPFAADVEARLSSDNS